MKFFRNMDEMELHLSLNAIRVAWFFTVMALFIWGIWDCVQTGRVTAPMYLLIFQNLLYFLALRVGRWRAGDRDGARSFLLYVPLLVVFLLAFGLLLRCGNGLDHGGSFSVPFLIRKGTKRILMEKA